MRSLRQKLAELPPDRATAQRKDLVRATAGAALPAEKAPETETPAKTATPKAKPTLEELRARIAALVGQKEPVRPRPDPTAGELPFFVERTPAGPRYIRRVAAAKAARVGRAPLWAARAADAATLGLLALDPSIGACDPKKALYLDTETTGLAGGTGTVAFLVGLAFFDEAQGTFVLEQMLLRRLGEEVPILEQLERRLAGASMIVTYNGKSFDVPLLSARYVMNRLKKPDVPPHLDLLHIARRIHKHRLTTCNLATIESHVLGRERMGDVAGADIVEAYAHFLRTGDEGSLHGVVTHNEHDVLAMVALLGLYGEPFGEKEAGAEAPSGPGAGLGASDLAGIARTLARAGAKDRAHALALASVRAGGGPTARRVSADLLRARGEIAAALGEYETLLTEVDDPEVRLVLAKLYEHKARALEGGISRAYERALEVLSAGTTEGDEATRRRRARIEKKLSSVEALPARRKRSNARRDPGSLR